MRQNKWEKGHKWGSIIEGYIKVVKNISFHATNVTVIFDGYKNSTKDHTHRCRKKHFCHDMKINRDTLPYTSKEKFLSNSKNKYELISTLSKELNSENILTFCCEDDADTVIVKEALNRSLVGTVQVRAEDADILIMLCHHYDVNIHNKMVLTTAKASYDVNDIIKSLSDEKRQSLLFCHSFSGCDTVSSILGFSKESVFEKLSNNEVRNHVYVFYNKESTVDEIKHAGISMFQYLYKDYDTPLSTQRVNRFNQQSKVGVLRPESLPPTEGAAIVNLSLTVASRVGVSEMVSQRIVAGCRH